MHRYICLSKYADLASLSPPLLLKHCVSSLQLTRAVNIRGDSFQNITHSLIAQSLWNSRLLHSKLHQQIYEQKERKNRQEKETPLIHVFLGKKLQFLGCMDSNKDFYLCLKMISVEASNMQQMEWSFRCSESYNACHFPFQY